MKMSKTAEKLPTVNIDETNLPAVAQQTGMSAEAIELLKEYSDMGASSSASDNIVPLIYVLQPLSPQVARRNPAYIEGAEPGMFWIRNASHPLVSGDEGIVVQPVYNEKYWAEWRPREAGGGMVKRHPAHKDDDFTPTLIREAVPVIDPETQRPRKWTINNGNDLMMTRSFVFRVFTERDGVLPYVMNFKSTENVTAKTLSSMINSMCGGKGAGALFRLTVKERTNSLGSWFGTDVKFERYTSIPEIQAGVELHKAFKSGDKIAEETTTPSGAVGSDDMKDDVPF
jgi:hypothetical protein